MKIDATEIKKAARGRWPEILQSLAPELSEAIAACGRNVRCPFPDHDDQDPSFRFDDQGDGRATCSCSGEHDGLGLLMKLRGWDFPTTLRQIADKIGINGNGTSRTTKRDIFAEVCSLNRISVDALTTYGGKETCRNDYPCVRIPVYNEAGETHSYFDLGVDTDKLQKGLFRAGKGSGGLFFPGRLPEPGEEWILAVGVKNACVFFALGYLACGLNTDQMAVKYAKLFKGVNVVVMRDRTVEAEEKAKKTAGKLYGVAARVRVGTLPDKGDDAQDVLTLTNRAKLLRKAIADALKWQPDEGTPELPSVALPGGHVKVIDSARKLGFLMSATGRYFQRGGSISRLDAHDTDDPILVSLKPAHMPSAFETVARLVRFTIDKEKGIIENPTTCDEKVAKLIIHSEQFTRELPIIRVLTRCPVLIERDHKLIEVVDYDAQSGVMAGGWASTEISTDDAVKLLLELIQDFQFATPSDKSRAVAAIITPALVFGGLLGGRPPIDLGEADASQTGKGFRNKLTTAIYGQTVKTVAQRVGGVGSLEESFDTALIKGACFISLDNIRGKIDSPSIESFLTEDSYQARIPYFAPVDIDPRRIVVMMTSNRAEITPDLANRASCTRFLKHPEGHQFAKYPEGDILDHVRANRNLYIGAVFATIREWHNEGKPTTEEARHDFRKWAGTLDWIVQNVFGLPPLLDGHRTTQQRMANPALNWLRDVALLVRHAEMFDQWLRSFQILDLLEDNPDIETPGLRPDDDLNDESTRMRILQAIGRRLKQCFKDEDVLSIDAISVERGEAPDDEHRKRFHYRFASRNPRNPRGEEDFIPEREDRCSSSFGAHGGTGGKGGTEVDNNCPEGVPHTWMDTAESDGKTRRFCTVCGKFGGFVRADGVVVQTLEELEDSNDE